MVGAVGLRFIYCHFWACWIKWVLLLITSLTFVWNLLVGSDLIKLKFLVAMKSWSFWLYSSTVIMTVDFPSSDLAIMAWFSSSFFFMFSKFSFLIVFWDLMWGCYASGYTQKNGAVSKIHKKFTFYLTWAQPTPSAAATVQISHALLTILQCVHPGSHDTHPHGNQIHPRLGVACPL
jgi:hypothetical protein